jgi:aphidicolan-16beta-ol synthase/syn-copalyl-diphosphate synthase
MAIQRGQQFIAERTSLSSSIEESLWIEKVSFTSPKLHRAYVLAALYVTPCRRQLGYDGKVLVPLEEAQMSKFIALSGKLPMLMNKPEWLIIASWIESRLFLSRLRPLRTMVFQREGVSEDKYFDWIPFLWTVASNINGSRTSSGFLMEMMTLSFLNYQADEFMESIVAGGLGHDFLRIRKTVDAMFASADGTSNGHSNGDHDSTREPESVGVEDARHEATSQQTLFRVISNLRRYIDWVMNNEGIQAATQTEKDRLCMELKRFLQAHISQQEDNQAFFLQKPKDAQTHCPIFRSARQEYRDWVSTTSAQHTSCPFSFEFVICWLSARQATSAAVMATIEQRYLASEICQHLATMCRMYNDLGSLKRDRREWNVNSLNFPEFHTDGSMTTVGGEDALKKQLFDLAQYERKCLNLAMDGFSKITSPETMQAFRVFVDITDLFGQIYVVKDIASQRQAH